MMNKTNSEGWNKFSNKVSEILSKIPSNDFRGGPVDECDPWFKDAVGKLMNLSLKLYGLDNVVFTEHTATMLVHDELEGRKENEDEAEAMVHWSQYNNAINQGVK